MDKFKDSLARLIWFVFKWTLIVIAVAVMSAVAAGYVYMHFVDPMAWLISLVIVTIILVHWAYDRTHPRKY